MADASKVPESTGDGQRTTRRRFLQGVAGAGAISGVVAVFPATVFGTGTAVGGESMAEAGVVIGYLSPVPLRPRTPYYAAFLEGLAELGYGEKNVLPVEAAADPPAAIARLVSEGVRVMVASSTPLSDAAAAANTGVPIVAVGVAAPRPGVTGVASLTPKQSVKLLNLLTAAFPAIKRIAVLHNAANRSKQAQFAELHAAGQARGLTVDAFTVADTGGLKADFESAFNAFAPQPPEPRYDGLILLSDPLMVTNAAALTVLAATHNIYAIYETREFAQAGGLMAYGPDRAGMYRQAGRIASEICSNPGAALPPVQDPQAPTEVFIHPVTARSPYGFRGQVPAELAGLLVSENA